VPSSSVHLPAELIERLDRVAKQTHSSRNRIIVRACEAYLARAQRSWPDDFFTEDRLSSAERKELRRSLAAWLEDLAAGRRSREESPF
jgi:predicted transcriptional regulator